MSLYAIDYRKDAKKGLFTCPYCYIRWHYDVKNSWQCEHCGFKINNVKDTNDLLEKIKYYRELIVENER